MNRKTLGSIMALAALIGAGIYLMSVRLDAPKRPQSADADPPHAPARLSRTDYEFIPESRLRSRVSNWHASRQARYRTLLTGGRFDVLVVPFLPRAHPVDPIGRSLMTRDLVRYLRETAGLRAPDPGLVELALGPHRRHYDAPDIRRLASEIGAERIIEGFADYTERNRLRISLVSTKVHAVRGVTLPGESRTWKDLHFSDARLPYEVFYAILPEVAEWMGLEASALAAQPAHQPQTGAGVPESFETMLATAGDPIKQAYHLQLAGTLHPSREPRTRQRLFERSLVALRGVPEETADYRLLKARALFHLHRRPAALAVLGAPSSASERALHALMQGNLPALREAVSQIEGDLARLIAAFEVRELEHRYGASEEPSELSAWARDAEWGVYVSQRMTESDLWKLPSNRSLKEGLDAVFPLEGADAESLLRGDLITRGTFTRDEDYALWVLRHTHRVLETAPADFCCGRQTELSRLDWLEWFAAQAASNLVKSMEHELTVQGQPRDTLEMYERARPVLSGHPGFAAVYAGAFVAAAKTAPTGDRSSLLADALQGAFDAAAWSAGQGPAHERALEVDRKANQLTWQYGLQDQLQILGRPRLRLLFTADFPQRPYGYGASAVSPKDSGLLGVHETIMESRPWDYTYAEPGYVYEAAVRLESKEGRDAAEAFLKRHRGRFEGHARLLELIAYYKRKMGDLAGVEAVYLDAIDEGTTEWAPYEYVGRIQLERGDYAEALSTYMSYPGFDAEDGYNRVQLSNQAYIAGSMLFWRGAHEQARPLLQLAAGYRTGSGGSLGGEMRVALLDGDFVGAARIALRRVRRYGDSYAHRDFMMLLHLLGYHEQAWAAFDSMLPRMAKPHIWTAAFVGHRIQGASSEEIRAWLESKAALAAGHAGHSLPARYAVMALLLDRGPDPGAATFAEQLAVEYPPHLDQPFQERPGANVGDFANGYSALVSKDYEGAYDHLSRLFTRPMFAPPQALPYLAWAAVKAGKVGEIENALSRLEDSESFEFDYLLATTFISAGQGRHQEAVSRLREAFGVHPYTDTRSVFVWYQLVETCEWLYEDAGVDAYRELALDWARRHQAIQPMFAWAYAVEAKYTEDPDRRRTALGYAIYLDRHSRRLDEFTDAELEAAERYFETLNPFQPDTSEEPSGAA